MFSQADYNRLCLTMKEQTMSCPAPQHATFLCLQLSIISSHYPRNLLPISHTSYHPSNPNNKHRVAGRPKAYRIFNLDPKLSFYILHHYHITKMCRRTCETWHQCGCQKWTAESCYPYKCPGVTKFLIQREGACVKHRMNDFDWTVAKLRSSGVGAREVIDGEVSPRNKTAF